MTSPSPLRGGLTYAQLGTGLITLVVMFFVYAIVVAPLSAAMRLSPLSNLGLMAFVLFAPPVIVAQRMIAPMPHGKTIGGYLRSLMRFTFDDKVYRRGRPIDTPTIHREGPMRHDWIVWEPAEEFSKEFSTDLLLTRESIERRFTGTVHRPGLRPAKRVPPAPSRRTGPGRTRRRIGEGRLRAAPYRRLGRHRPVRPSSKT